MKLSPFFTYAVTCNIILASFYVYKYKKDAACITKTEILKKECLSLECQARTLTKQLHSIRERSALETYAKNNLGMEKINPKQKRTLGSI